MNHRRRVVRFAMSSVGNEPEGMQTKLAPERVVETSRIGVWIALTAILWSLIAIPTLVI